MIWPHFRFLDRNLSNFYVVFWKKTQKIVLKLLTFRRKILKFRRPCLQINLQWIWMWCLFCRGSHQLPSHTKIMERWNDRSCHHWLFQKDRLIKLNSIPTIISKIRKYNPPLFKPRISAASNHRRPIQKHLKIGKKRSAIFLNFGWMFLNFGNTNYILSVQSLKSKQFFPSLWHR